MDYPLLLFRTRLQAAEVRERFRFCGGLGDGADFSNYGSGGSHGTVSSLPLTSE